MHATAESCPSGDCSRRSLVNVRRHRSQGEPAPSVGVQDCAEARPSGGPVRINDKIIKSGLIDGGTASANGRRAIDFLTRVASAARAPRSPWRAPEEAEPKPKPKPTNNAMMQDRRIRQMKANDTVHEEAREPGFCSDCKTRVSDVSSDRSLPLLADSRDHGIDSSDKLNPSNRPRSAGRMRMRRRRLGHAPARHGRQTSLDRESDATAKSGRRPVFRSRRGSGCTPDLIGPVFVEKFAEMAKSKKPAQRPQKGRVRPANKPSGSGETGPAPEVPSGCDDGSGWEEPKTDFLVLLDLLTKGQCHVIDAISDDPHLVDAAVRLRCHFPGLLHRLWEMQSEKLGMTKYLLDSSAKAMQVCETYLGLPEANSAYELARQVFRGLEELLEHQRKSVSELEKAINDVLNGHYPMTPD